MILDIQDGMLISCQLEEHDHGVVDLVWNGSITGIAQGAFAGAAAELRELYLPRTLRLWDQRAFAGVGELDVLAAPTLARQRWDDLVDRGLGLFEFGLHARHLIVLEGEGDMFYVNLLLANQPERVSMLASQRVYDCGRAYDEREEGPTARQLDIYVEEGDRLHAPGHEAAQEVLQTLRIVNRYARTYVRDEQGMLDHVEEWDLYHPALIARDNRIAHPRLSDHGARGRGLHWEPCLTDMCDLRAPSLRNLERLVLPEGMRCIGAESFECCPKLTRVRIPSSVSHIGNAAFGGCEALSSVNVDKAAQIEVDPWAFGGCPRLRSVSLRFRDREGARERVERVPLRDWLATQRAAMLAERLEACYPEVFARMAMLYHSDSLYEAMTGAASNGDARAADSALKTMLGFWGDCLADAEGCRSQLAGEGPLPADTSQAELTRLLLRLYLEAAARA